MNKDKEKTDFKKIIADKTEIISKTLSKGERVELVPVKDGVKIFHIDRKEIK